MYLQAYIFFVTDYDAQLIVRCLLSSHTHPIYIPS